MFNNLDVVLKKLKICHEIKIQNKSMFRDNSIKISYFRYMDTSTEAKKGLLDTEFYGKKN